MNKKLLISLIAIGVVVLIVVGVVLGVVLSVPKTFMVTFDSDGGTSVASQTIQKGELVSEPVNPTKTDYEFIAWYLGEKEWDFDIDKVEKDITLKAKWKKIITEPEVETFEIVFKNGDTILKIEEVEKGGSATAPSNPTKESTIDKVFTFKGWDKSFTNVTSDLEVNAIFTESVRKYEVVFKNYDGSVLKTERVEYGSSATAPSSPTKESTIDKVFTFKGWDKSFTNVTSDLEVNAEFIESIRSYEVVFKNYDGSVLKTERVEYGSSATAPDNPSRENTAQYNYVFKGWNKDFSNIIGDLEVIAEFKEIDLTQFTFTLINNDTEYSIKAKDTTVLGDITIPSTYMGKPVISIGYEAFLGCTGLTSIEIPASVTSIGTSAFEDCSSLERIVVEKGNTIYHSDGNCLIKTATKTLVAGCKASTIPNDGSVTSIGNSAFSGCSGLTSIEIPASVTSIGYGAFYYCSSLTSIEIPAGLTSIGGYAFEGCSSLTSIEIPADVTSIGEYAFYGCTNLTIYAEAKSELSGWDKYWNYNNRPVYWEVTAKDYIMEDNIQYVIQGENAVVSGHSANITRAVIKDQVTINGTVYPVTSIRDNAFSYCLDLTSIEIPTSVTSIGKRAFTYCLNLTSIEIPASVTSIGEYAFSYCLNLTITCPYTEAEATEKWGTDWTKGSKEVIYKNSVIA